MLSCIGFGNVHFLKVVFPTLLLVPLPQISGTDDLIFCEVRPKKVALFPEVVWLKVFLSLTRPHKSNVYQNIHFKKHLTINNKNNNNNNKKARIQKKTKETNEEKRISLENRLKK